MKSTLRTLGYIVAGGIALGAFVKGLMWYGDPDQYWHRDQRNRNELMQSVDPSTVPLSVGSRMDLAYKRGMTFEDAYAKIRSLVADLPYGQEMAQARFEQLQEMNRSDLSIVVEQAIAQLPKK